MIPEEILIEFNASLIKVAANEIIIVEKKRADFYFQIQTGEVKMFNINEKGKEFVQGIFGDGESFGEPPLFADVKYPAFAIALKPTLLFKLKKEDLFALLQKNFEIHLKFTQTLSKRLFYKSTILKEISGHPPEHRILTLIDFFKKKEGISTLFQVEFTRQQIADLTGLRVETVIRSIKKLAEEGELQIVKHKVFR